MKKIGRLEFFKNFLKFYIISYLFAIVGIILSSMFNKFLFLVATPSIFFQLCLQGAFHMRAIDFIKDEGNAACFAFTTWGISFVGGCYYFWSTYFINLYDKKEISELPFFISKKLAFYADAWSFIFFILLLVFLFAPSKKEEVK